MTYVSKFETELGVGAVVASKSGVQRVYLPHEGIEDTLLGDGFTAKPSSELTERVAQMLKRYFKGEQQPFESVPVDLNLSSQFRLQVLELIRSIPFGGVLSYGKVACLAGSPGAARAVGGAMAANPVPIIIPCHRVIAANGRLTGYSATGGLKIKKNLLQLEHVEFKGELVCQGK